MLGGRVGELVGWCHHVAAVASDVSVHCCTCPTCPTCYIPPAHLPSSIPAHTPLYPPPPPPHTHTFARAPLPPVIYTWYRQVGGFEAYLLADEEEDEAAGAAAVYRQVWVSRARTLI